MTDSGPLFTLGVVLGVCLGVLLEAVSVVSGAVAWTVLAAKLLAGAFARSLNRIDLHVRRRVR